MSDHLTPLDVCIYLFGSRAAVEKIAGSAPKGSYAWGRPSSQRAAGDLPPWVLRKMLKAARRRKMPLTGDHLILGMSQRAAFELREQVRAQAGDKLPGLKSLAAE